MLRRSASTRASALPLASFHISCRFSESPGKCCLIEERFGLCEHIGSKVLHHAPMPSFGQASSRLGDERDGPHGNEPLTHRADGSRAAAAKDTGATDDVSQRNPLTAPQAPAHTTNAARLGAAAGSTGPRTVGFVPADRAGDHGLTLDGWHRLSLAPAYGCPLEARVGGWTDDLAAVPVRADQQRTGVPWLEWLSPAPSWISTRPRPSSKRCRLDAGRRMAT